MSSGIKKENRNFLYSVGKPVYKTLAWCERTYVLYAGMSGTGYLLCETMDDTFLAKAGAGLLGLGVGGGTSKFFKYLGRRRRKKEETSMIDHLMKKLERKDRARVNERKHFREDRQKEREKIRKAHERELERAMKRGMKKAMKRFGEKIGYQTEAIEELTRITERSNDEKRKVNNEKRKIYREKEALSEELNELKKKLDEYDLE